MKQIKIAIFCVLALTGFCENLGDGSVVPDIHQRHFGLVCGRVTVCERSRGFRIGFRPTNSLGLDQKPLSLARVHAPAEK